MPDPPAKPAAKGPWVRRHWILAGLHALGGLYVWEWAGKRDDPPVDVPDWPDVDVPAPP